MTTLADELLNDFEDSGSEGGDDQPSSFLQDDPTTESANEHARASSASQLNGGMELDGDEEDVGEEDEEMGGADGASIEDAVDEEEAKAKIEKMQLGGVSDVRNVAGLMKTLQPVLEVSTVGLLPLP